LVIEKGYPHQHGLFDADIRARIPAEKLMIGLDIDIRDYTVNLTDIRTGVERTVRPGIPEIIIFLGTHNVWTLLVCTPANSAKFM